MNEFLQAHGSNVSGLFGRIAGVYDFLNRILSLGFDAWWRKKLAKSIHKAIKNSSLPVLDLAAGTMEVSIEIAKRYPEKKIFAVDFCQPMLLAGFSKLKKISKGTIFPVVGDGRVIPLPDNSVCAITIAFGIRNITPRSEVFKEAMRVLSPGGSLCILEFGSARDHIFLGLYNWYLFKFLPIIGKVVSKDKNAYQYLADTIHAFPSAVELAEEMIEKKFRYVQYTRMTGGIVCLHTGIK